MLADESKADVLLMDEMKGRQVAKNMSLPLAGSIGVLIGALEKGLINPDEIERAVVTLKNSNRRISEELLQMVVDKAREFRKKK